jgi:hypothetical protein
MKGVLVNRKAVALMAGITIFMVASTGARADAIDGDWCFGSLALNIQGPRIRTPGGTELAGSYSRHDFSYVVPANEPGAGGQIAMSLRGDELMLLQRASESTPESWRRCKPTS